MPNLVSIGIDCNGSWPRLGVVGGDASGCPCWLLALVVVAGVVAAAAAAAAEPTAGCPLVGDWLALPLRLPSPPPGISESRILGLPELLVTCLSTSLTAEAIALCLSIECCFFLVLLYLSLCILCWRNVSATTGLDFWSQIFSTLHF